MNGRIVVPTSSPHHGTAGAVREFQEVRPMTAILIPVAILVLVLVASLFASDSRDGRDWTSLPVDALRRPVARRTRTS